MKKQNKNTISKKCDKEWSNQIHKKGKCEICGSTRFLNAHHIIGRRNLHLRHKLKNGCLLCSLDHTFGRNSAHQNPVWFMDWVENNRHEDLEYLRKEQFVLETNYDYNLALEELLNEK